MDCMVKGMGIAKAAAATIAYTRVRFREVLGYLGDAKQKTMQTSYNTLKHVKYARRHIAGAYIHWSPGHTIFHKHNKEQLFMQSLEKMASFKTRHTSNIMLLYWHKWYQHSNRYRCMMVNKICEAKDLQSIKHKFGCPDGMQYTELL